MRYGTLPNVDKPISRLVFGTATPILFAAFRSVYGEAPDFEGRLNAAFTLLDDMYMRFNVDHPEDFRGHSLSVSDIVAIRQNGVVSCYYVDYIGFKELPDFIKSKKIKR